MGGDGQPYMYDRPRSDTTFNPRAASEASKRAAKPKPKQEGPLISFNQHPDSYLILPYGNTNVKPMSMTIVGAVKWVRWFQLLFRICQLVGAIGILICVIMIRGTQDTEGWVIRIPVRCILLCVWHWLTTVAWI
jgi:hypothetical protein